MKTTDITLLNLDPPLTIRGIKVKGCKSDVRGDPIKQLRKLVGPSGSFSQSDRVRLLAWSEDKGRWYAWYIPKEETDEE